VNGRTTTDRQWRIQQAYALAQLAGYELPSPAWTPTRYANLALLALYQLDKPPDWWGLYNWDWCNLLRNYPQLADKVPNWGVFTGGQWAALLVTQPQFIDHVPKRSSLCNTDWQRVLVTQPQLSEHPLLRETGGEATTTT